MKPPISKFKVYGRSMYPTLQEGQEVLTFNWGKVKPGDIVVVKNQKIKRVQKIMGNQVFLVGDNKEQSSDSRHFGPVDISQIIGKVIYPPNGIPCPQCGFVVSGVWGRKDTICQNCGFKLPCCGE